MPTRLDLNDEETTVLKGVISRLNVPILEIALLNGGEELAAAEYEMFTLLKIYKRL